MGKKNKKGKTGVAEADTGMPRHLRREILAIANELLEKCSIPFGSQSTEWNDFLDVYQIIEKLRKKQQNYVLHHGKREDNLNGFVDWLHTNGVDTSGVAIADFGTRGYGLKAERDLTANELLLSIPRKLMMTTQTAKTSILGPLMGEDRILQSMPNVAMALHVLCEFSQQDSFWQPYLNFLPKSYTTTLYFSPDEIQLLKSSPSLSDVLNQFRNITRQYAYFFRLFQGHDEAGKLPIKNFCYDDYRWAVSTVMTRQNQIPSTNSDEMDTALIPLWDMCNHTNGQMTTDFSRENDRSECLALKDFKQGEEVLIFYGPRSNAEFMLHSGFVFEENEYDRLALRMGVSKNDILYSMKAEVLARIPLKSNGTFYLYADALNPVDCDLLAYLRVFSMDKDTLVEYLFGEGVPLRQKQLKEFSTPVSKANELKVWSFLETRARLLLKAYPTTIQEDSELLAKDGLSENSRLAIKLRRCEKQILGNVVEYCSQQQKHVQEHFCGDKECAESTGAHHLDVQGKECVCIHSVEILGDDSKGSADVEKISHECTEENCPDQDRISSVEKVHHGVGPGMVGEPSEGVEKVNECNGKDSVAEECKDKQPDEITECGDGLKSGDAKSSLCDPGALEKRDDVAAADASGDHLMVDAIKVGADEGAENVTGDG